ncbi:MAG: thioredoxin family protein [Acidobacteria bacterium]|nr:MAG: thioredoxin family protein [Acidobacteriota bacterium]
MKRTHLVGLTIWTLVTAMWAMNALAGDGGERATVGAPAPTFTLEDQNGRPVSLSDFTGKIVVLEWVNPDCPFVQRHYRAGTMKRLAEKYQSKGVVWLAINSTYYMGKEDNRRWIEKYKLPYPILDDHTGRVGRLYGAKTTPHMFIIDTSGKLVYQGGIDDDPRGAKNGGALNYVERALDELLAGKPVSISQSKPYGCSVKYAKTSTAY